MHEVTINPDVFIVVRSEVARDPGISREALKQKAEALDREIRQLSMERFLEIYEDAISRGDALGGRKEMRRRRRVVNPVFLRKQKDQAPTRAGARSASAEPLPEILQPDSRDLKERVMYLVESLMERHPQMANQELQQEAAEVDPAIADLTLRQFYARFPLQIRRKQNPQWAEKATRARRPGKSPTRDEIRGGLLEVAAQLADAESHSELVTAIAGIDEIVDGLFSPS